MSLLGLSSRDAAKKVMDEYVKHFNSKMAGLEMVRRKRHYFPKVKDAYLDKVSRYMRPPPLTEKQLQILAYIYTKKRVELSRLKEIFGSRVYSDVKKFTRLGIVSRRSGNRGFVVVIREEAEPLIRSRRRAKI
jgi:chromosome segregation and condensation protein ScpB